MAELRVTFARSGRTVPWDPRGSLLDLAEAHGVEIPWCCRAGTDRVCVTQIHSGEVEHLPGACVERPDECLPCVARPRTNLVLEA